jgi:hypothetical protein
MSYTFRGIITDATEPEWTALRTQVAYCVVVDPATLLIAEVHGGFPEIDDVAKRISAAILGRTVVAMEYMTWAGVLERFSASVFRNGRVADGLCFRDVEGGMDKEPLFRVMLELGVVLPDGGYFRPFDRSMPGHVGG